MKFKHFLGTALAIAVTCATMSTANAADVTLRFANVTNQPSIDAGQVLVDVAAKESNGRLEIKHFPNNMLGDDRTVTESMLMGDIALVQTQPSVLASMVPDLYVWDAPFLFDKIEDAWKCLDGPLGHAVNDQVESKGLKYLAALENGYRHYTSLCGRTGVLTLLLWPSLRLSLPYSRAPLMLRKTLFPSLTLTSYMRYSTTFP